VSKLDIHREGEHLCTASFSHETFAGNLVLQVYPFPLTPVQKDSTDSTQHRGLPSPLPAAEMLHISIA